MKKLISIIVLIAVILLSCNNIFDSRTSIAEQWLRENINRYGNFDVKLIRLKKSNGQEFKDPSTGEEKYKLEFIADCECLDDCYATFEDKKEATESNLTFNTEKSAKQQAGILDSYFREGCKTCKHYTYRFFRKGDVLKYSDQIVMIKKENGWVAIGLDGVDD